MTRRPTVGGAEGETGGLWRQDKLECASCTAVIVHDVFEKIGSMRESWRIERPPTRVTTTLAIEERVLDDLLDGVDLDPPVLPRRRTTTH